jgi:hypothetical protein
VSNNHDVATMGSLEAAEHSVVVVVFGFFTGP